ncbi:unnamed protein product [marine sediment metagenome]|uniref:Uncharacterized protein n=1 Tax=marine sediment metagenome TaxID=412755 RepID=X1GP14_9ZZZZ
MPDDDLRIGVFVCECGVNIAATVDCDEATEFSKGLPGVVFAIKNKYTCSVGSYISMPGETMIVPTSTSIISSFIS